jgi:hypothetical protein
MNVAKTPMNRSSSLNDNLARHSDVTQKAAASGPNQQWATHLCHMLVCTIFQLQALQLGSGCALNGMPLAQCCRLQ